MWQHNNPKNKPKKMFWKMENESEECDGAGGKQRAWAASAWRGLQTLASLVCAFSGTRELIALPGTAPSLVHALSVATHHGQK